MARPPAPHASVALRANRLRGNAQSGRNRGEQRGQREHGNVRASVVKTTTVAFRVCVGG